MGAGRGEWGEGEGMHGFRHRRGVGKLDGTGTLGYVTLENGQGRGGGVGTRCTAWVMCIEIDISI